MAVVVSCAVWDSPSSAIWGRKHSEPPRHCPNPHINQKGGTTKRVNAKMRSWTRVRRNGVSRARAQDFLFLIVETGHFDTYPNWFGYISDTYQ